MVLSKCCTQNVSKSGRLSSGHRTGKDQFSFQFPRKAVLKIAQIIRQLHSSPMLARSCLKSCMLGFSITWIKNFQTSNLGLEKAEESEIKLLTSVESSKKQEIPKKHLLLLHWMHNSLKLCVSQQTVESSSKEGNTRLPYCLLRNLHTGFSGNK